MQIPSTERHCEHQSDHGTDFVGSVEELVQLDKHAVNVEGGTLPS